jgi:hypothetical protein
MVVHICYDTAEEPPLREHYTASQMPTIIGSILAAAVVLGLFTGLYLSYRQVSVSPSLVARSQVRSDVRSAFTVQPSARSAKACRNPLDCFEISGDGSPRIYNCNGGTCNWDAHEDLQTLVAQSCDDVADNTLCVRNARELGRCKGGKRIAALKSELATLEQSARSDPSAKTTAQLNSLRVYIRSPSMQAECVSR